MLAMTNKVTGPTQWLSFLVIDTLKGRKELTFPGLPDEISLEELTDLVREWVKRELVSRGIIADLRIYKDHTVEIWCSTREVDKKGFGNRLKVWDDPHFTGQLSQSFADAVNEVLTLHYPEKVH